MKKYFRPAFLAAAMGGMVANHVMRKLHMNPLSLEGHAIAGISGAIGVGIYELLGILPRLRIHIYLAPDPNS